MCGIAGVLTNDFSIDERKVRLQNMLLSQKHRGPDAQQDWHDASCSLGHNRLSIIDLSSVANQPMMSACGRYAIVFNGELYNYLEIKKELLPYFKFQTHSDTEVLLNAYIFWGKEALNKFNGMFSFAIWDTYTKELFVARDRFGVKPFYYAVVKNSFVFASEIKSLWEFGIKKEKNNKVWANYLCYATYGLPNETFWNSINQLPAGHFAIISEKTITNFKVVQWYDFVSNITKTPVLASSNLKEQYSELLQDAIKIRFRADVPLGMNVSGGLDSSTLIALIHKNLPVSKKIEAFTFYCNDVNYDELPWVESLLKGKNYDLNKVLLTPNLVPDLIEKLSYIQDEPFGGFPTLAYSLLFQEARSKGIKVLLDGQGMDEAWAGYDYYHNQTQHVIQGLSTSPVRPEVLDSEFVLFAEKENYPQPFESKMQNMQFRDLFYTKIPRTLRFNDRISMLHGTELREPFLDYRLVELAFAQSDQVKYNQGNTKWMLRQISKDLMKAEVALAPKRPVQTPQREWIANQLQDYVSDQIQEFAKFDFVDAKKVIQIWESYKQGKQDNSFYIWQWINLRK